MLFSPPLCFSYRDQKVYWSSCCYCHAFFFSVSETGKEHGKGPCALQRTLWQAEGEAELMLNS